jgi:hypothetical protein
MLKILNSQIDLDRNLPSSPGFVNVRSRCYWWFGRVLFADYWHSEYLLPKPVPTVGVLLKNVIFL